MSTDGLASLMEKCLNRSMPMELSQRRNLANKFFTARNDIEVTNMLGFALGWEQLETATPKTDWSATLLFDAAQCKKILQPIVACMRSTEFCLLPLAIVRNDGKGVEMQMLIRVRISQTTEEYVDFTQRRYKSFNEFLESNRLPACTLHYPKDGKEEYDEEGKLCIDSRVIKHPINTLKTIAVVGSVVGGIAGTVLIPFAPLAASLVVAGTTGPMVGFAINDLVDGIRHERPSVVAVRGFALTTSLVTFANVGLIAAVKVERVRKMLSVGQLKYLQSAEAVMQNVSIGVTTTQFVAAVISSATGWQKLEPCEWLRLAANLCLAYRVSYHSATAVLLFNDVQATGVAKFFQTICRNILSSVSDLKNKILPRLDQCLGLRKILEDYISEGVQFSMDDDFTTLTIFGHTFEFHTLIYIDKDLLRQLFQQLMMGAATVATVVGTVCNTQTILNNPKVVMEVLTAVTNLCKLLCDIKCTAVELGKTIRFGKGHQFTVQTLLIWWNLPTHDRTLLLKALVDLDKEQTAQLNELRSSGRVDDSTFLNWLVITGPVEYGHTLTYRASLELLLKISELTGEEKIIFGDGNDILINELLSIRVQDRNVLQCETWRSNTFLRDQRFLRLCKDLESTLENTTLLDRARDAWIRTFRKDHLQLETIDLLCGLFAETQPLTLAEALDHALDHEGATVGQVYYNILFSCQTLNRAQERTAEERPALAARFRQLLLDSTKIGMNGYSQLTFVPQTSQEADSENEGVCSSTDAILHDELIAMARGLMQHTPFSLLKFPFGPAERAACWLQFVPALRNKEGRAQITQTLKDLLSNGTAKLLQQADGKIQRTSDGGCAIVFRRNYAKIIVELLPPSRDHHHRGRDWRGSIYLCNRSAMAVNWPPKEPTANGAPKPRQPWRKNA
ncbi:uncharacterized protein LOC128275027 [Anopheles cruzii]|uniref:uncharacterized protein LOC128275027 n=1 Tax=Anopheles cruzii TaxID=68878 RepID=UPI0022EC43F4|nr:uncharacterized protein LOC128275027 [Anopheles cruzii]